ncbi:transposase [Gordonia sp. PDNC005]|uniref:transposase n=1 Tax=unclassified Gordonia (in: high G+C Gram-positive bacteria) TaxID=2657482 RepID=UPI001966B11F|nr:transposase [Gordonia sp. PDNC005]QRY63018.1 transposase [Gordonia sp. PDNC005]
MPKKFSAETRNRAVRMVYDRQALEGGPRAEWTRAVAPQLGVGVETLRIWCNRHGPTDAHPDPQESLEQENRRLRRELAESRRANEILRAASAFSPRKPTAPRRDDRLHRQVPRSVLRSRPSAGYSRRQTVGFSPHAAIEPPKLGRPELERCAM